MINLNKAALLALTIKGDPNYITLAHTLKIYESMCKPYITAELTLLNNDGNINPLQLQIGDPVYFVLVDQLGQQYELETFLTMIPQEITSEGIRQEMVTLVSATIAYFRDRASRAQSSHMNVPVTTAVADIHAQFIQTPLLIEPSSGMIAKDTSGGAGAQMEKPFTIIKQLLNRAVYPAYPEAAVVYFEQHPFQSTPVHRAAPLSLFMDGGVGAVWKQKDTWGTNYMHMFGAEESENAILASKLYKKEDEAVGGSAGNIIASAAQAQTTLDQYARNPNKRDISAIYKANPRLAQQFASKYGGQLLLNMFDQARTDPSSDPSIKTTAQNAFVAEVKARTNYLVKVGLQAGIRQTVGNCVELELMGGPGPILADAGGGRRDVSGTLVIGKFVIADLMHEAYFDNRVVQGTTTIRAVTTEIAGG